MKDQINILVKLQKIETESDSIKLKLSDVSKRLETLDEGLKEFERTIEDQESIINELKKVVWLTRREVAYLTVLVIIVTIIAGISLGALDFGFSELVGRVFVPGN